MPKRDYRLYIIDVFIAINKIQRYTQNISDAQDLKWNEIVWDATIRELEIIGEATRILIKSNILENQEYRKIVDFRNIIAHGYFGLDEDEVFIVVKDKLTIFENELIELIKQKNILIEEALLMAIEENTKIPLLIQYLQKLNTRFTDAR